MKLISTLLTSVLFLTLNGQSALVLTEIMYNSPGEDVEFLEFYNNSSETLELAGYEMAEGVEYVFPDITLLPQTTFVITNDSIDFNRNYRGSTFVTAYEWTSGSLRNSGEELAVINNLQDTIIQLEYDDIAPWPHLADGLGPSMKICDVNGPMDDPTNWRTSDKHVPVILYQGGELYADPGEVSECRESSAFGFWLATPEFKGKLENDLIIDIPVYYEHTNNEGIVVVARPKDGTATLDVDYRILNDTLSYGPGQTSPEFITVQILEDLEIEPNEYVEFELVRAGSSIPIFLSFETFIYFGILDDDGPLTNDMELRGIIDAPQFKAIEIYAKQDVDQLRLLDFGIGSANNGNGSDSIEHVLQGVTPPGEACFFITNDTIEIKRFLGPIPNERLLLVDDLDFNGNDAIELYEKGQVIDVFGNIDEDGEGTAWEYSDGWAKKKSGGSNTIFNEDDWAFSGIGVLDVNTNNDANDPYVLECIPTAVGESAAVEGVKVFPNPTSGELKVIATSSIGLIKIIDLMGRVVRAEYSRSAILDLDLADLNSGIYLLQYERVGRIGVEKIVLE